MSKRVICDGRSALTGAASGVPTVLGNFVYIMSRDGTAWAINTEDGRVRWQLPGIPTESRKCGWRGGARGHAKM